MAYYFNLPPITDLTTDQQLAVNETKPLALRGGPGTGKSVVCLWRHIRNYATNSRKSLLLTYTKTLEHYLRQSSLAQNENCGEHISRTDRWLLHDAKEYDEIIIDEGQDIEKIHFEQYFNHTSSISYGADERQSLYLNHEQLTELLNWFKNDTLFEPNVSITLNRNFRNSQEILQFTQSVFPDYLIPHHTIIGTKKTELKPIMKINIGQDINNHAKEIVQIINDFHSQTHNIGILVPFAKKVDEYYNAIKQNLPDKVEISKYQNEHDTFQELSGVHVTTFKSSKGTEFDTVIIPTFDKFNWVLENMDKIGENDYYVAFTRAKTNLFLLCRNGVPNIGNHDTVRIE